MCERMIADYPYGHSNEPFDVPEQGTFFGITEGIGDA